MSRGVKDLRETLSLARAKENTLMQEKKTPRGQKVEKMDTKAKLDKLKLLAQKDKEFIVILQQRVATLSRELETRTKATLELQENGERISEQMQGRIAESTRLRKENISLYDQMTKQDHMLTAKDAELQKMRQSLGILENQVTLLQREHDDNLQNAAGHEAKLVATTVDLQREITSLQNKNNILEKQVQDLQRNESSKSSDLQQLEQELIVTRQSIREQEDSKRTIQASLESTKRDRDAFKAALGKLQAKHTELNATSKALEQQRIPSLEAQLESMRTAYAQIEQQNQLLTTKRTSSDSSMRDLIQDCEQLRARITYLEETARNKESEFANASVSSNRFRLQAVEMERKWTESARHEREMRSSLEALRFELETEKKSHDELREVISTLNVQRSKLVGKSEEIDRERDALKHRVRELETVQTELHEASSAHATDMSLLRKQLAEEQRKTRILKVDGDRVQTLTKKLEVSRSETENLVRQLTSNKADLEKLRAIEKEVHTAVAKLMSAQRGMEASFTCTSCVGMLTEPVTCVPCGDTFCKKCLSKARHSDDEGTICPECNVEVKSVLENNLLYTLSGKFIFARQTLSWLQDQLEEDKIDKKDVAAHARSGRRDSLSEMLASLKSERKQ